MASDLTQWGVRRKKAPLTSLRCGRGARDTGRKLFFRENLFNPFLASGLNSHFFHKSQRKPFSFNFLEQVPRNARIYSRKFTIGLLRLTSNKSTQGMSKQKQKQKEEEVAVEAADEECGPIPITKLEV